MTRPRLLLIPEFTELEWGRIRDALSEWAELATYDLPGVGDEPISDEDVEMLSRGKLSLHERLTQRALEEVRRRGWDRFFVVADGWANGTAARVAAELPGAVQGVALGHACLTFDMDSSRPALSREVWAAMRQLLRQGPREFVRHGIVQMTRGSVSDEEAAEMMERFPDRDMMEVIWEALPRDHEPIGDMLKAYGGPLLFAQHVGCLSFTDEGFRDAVDAFPHARVLRLPEAPTGRPEFADALRDFCQSVAAGDSARSIRAAGH